ncbi:uncharacterized protein LOC135836919 isoform X2 [Planococcus citri]|uniref:uncharacterized protein LOC135836919 isoform X2 n=1 Tax=Planococcus citri TaxID=170843 RepID=UPI0031F882DA
MDPCYVKVNLKFVLFSIIIALYFSTRSVEADLRHCVEVEDDEFQDMVTNKADEEYDGASIKKCLEKTNSEELFQEYVNSAESNQNTNRKPQEAFDIVETASGKNLKLSQTPAMKFFRGACIKLDFKPIEFYSLNDEKEKAETVQCLAKCVNKFLFRIKYALNIARDEAIKASSNKLTLEPTETSSYRLILNNNDKIQMVEKIPKPSREFTSEEFYAELKKANEPLSIDPISQVGKEYLISYNELYYNLDRYVVDSVRDSTTLIHIDINLLNMGEVYQDCAKVECGMDEASTPLLDLMRSATRKSSNTILKSFENDTEEVKNWVDKHTGDWRKFCQALVKY